LTALAIIPDRELAAQLASALERTRSFQILSEFKSYPSLQTLEIRARQTKPDVILLDLASDLDQACELIRCVTSLNLRAHLVGLHVRNDSDAILRSLRSGASEFLYAPFDVQTQNDAVARLHRLLQPGPVEQAEPGSIVTFSSAKPGSGASTLAAQAAFALRRTTAQRVLLADFDLMGGMIGFYLKLTNTKSLLDALQMAERLQDGGWAACVAATDGVDISAGARNALRRTRRRRPAARCDGTCPHELRVGGDRPAGGFSTVELDDDFRIRSRVSGLDTGVAESALSAQGRQSPRSFGLPQGTLPDCDEPHRPARRDRRIRYRTVI
jgi:DNA-binding NarL/FixJ family response regulator